MKQKSLRQLARELGVSASYLSQVKHGKRPPSEKVLSILDKSVKQNTSAEEQNRTADTRIFSPLLYHLSYLGRLKYSRFSSLRCQASQVCRVLLSP